MGAGAHIYLQCYIASLPPRLILVFSNKAGELIIIFWADFSHFRVLAASGRPHKIHVSPEGETLLCPAAGCPTGNGLEGSTGLHSMFSRPACVRQMALTKTTTVCKTCLCFANDCCFLSTPSAAHEHVEKTLTVTDVTVTDRECTLPLRFDMSFRWRMARRCGWYSDADR